MNLDTYKKYLDRGTFDGLEIEKESLSRYYSFKFCKDYLNTLPYIADVLELGTSRSFVDGRYEGCNLDDTRYWEKDNLEKWDWGAGCSTLIFSEYNLVTLDLISSHLSRSKFMSESLGFLKNKYICRDSISFLRECKETFDLIYLDTGDMFPIEPTLNLQLSEAICIVENNLLKYNGLLLIDDVLNKTPRTLGVKDNKYGKSDKALPYLLSKGFEIIHEGYQYILRKK
jgi:hypothetical protein